MKKTDLILTTMAIAFCIANLIYGLMDSNIPAILGWSCAALMSIKSIIYQS